MGKIKFRPIIVDDSQEELIEHGASDFPLSMDIQTVDSKDCARIPHWHYNIQISVVIKGSVLFRTPVGEFLLRVGEGIFINRGVFHEIVETEDKGSAYLCVNFCPEIVYGQSDNMLRRKYVDPVVFDFNMQIVSLNSEPWHKDICDMVLEMEKINEAQDYGYELETKIILCKIWTVLLKNNKEELTNVSAVSFSDKRRLEAMQAFIHGNYTEKIMLKDIARAAHISNGECCRVFKRVLHMRPMVYLMQYRIAQSIKMLTCTETNISDIALESGFNSGSYYAECFKSVMGCTPIQYRKQRAESSLKEGF